MNCQNIIENSSMKFLNIPASSRHNYLGKAGIVSPDEHIDLTLANPAHLEYSSKGKLIASTSLYFQSLYSHVGYTMNNYKFDIPYQVGITYLNYGEQRRMDLEGNESGIIKPFEFSAYIAASKTYEHYKFGANLKIAFANYIDATAAGAALDLSMLYRDDDRMIYATLLLKNIGFQFMASGTEAYSAPFDIQMAISKKFKHNPLRISIAIQELYQWSAATTTKNGYGYDIFLRNNLYQLDTPSIHTAILSHFVFGIEANLGKGFKLGANYDVNKGMENKFENMRGLTGLGLGFGIYTRKFDLGYALSKFGPIGSNHTFTLTMHMNEWIKR